LARADGRDLDRVAPAEPDPAGELDGGRYVAKLDPPPLPRADAAERDADPECLGRLAPEVDRPRRRERGEPVEDEDVVGDDRAAELVEDGQQRALSGRPLAEHAPRPPAVHERARVEALPAVPGRGDRRRRAEVRMEERPAVERVARAKRRARGLPHEVDHDRRTELEARARVAERHRRLRGLARRLRQLRVAPGDELEGGPGLVGVDEERVVCDRAGEPEAVCAAPAGVTRRSVCGRAHEVRVKPMPLGGRASGRPSVVAAGPRIETSPDGEATTGEAWESTSWTRI